MAEIPKPTSPISIAKSILKKGGSAERVSASACDNKSLHFEETVPKVSSSFGEKPFSSSQLEIVSGSPQKENVNTSITNLLNFFLSAIFEENCPSMVEETYSMKSL